MEDEKRKKTLIMVGSLLILLCVLIVIFLIIITNGNETKTSTETEGEKLEALVCRSGGREDGFFHSETVNQIANEVKVTFDNEKFDKLYYSYEGVYRSTEVADQDELKMHAAYNIHMGENELSQESLSPVYSVTKNKLHLTLYAEDEGDFNKATARFFYVDDENVEKFKRFDIDEMKKYYESKDFDCDIVK